MNPFETLKTLNLPFAQLLGIVFLEAETDRVVAKMSVREDLCTVGNSVHGGAIMALADTVGAAATLINLPAGAQGTTTIESKTNFVSPARTGTTLMAIASPVHRGRRTQVWNTRIEGDGGRLIAFVTQTQMVL